MSCLFLLMSLETESRNIERKDTLMVQEGSVCCSRHLGVPESLDIFSGVWKRDHRAYNGRGECVTAECRGCYYIFNVWLKLSEINCHSRMRQRPTFFVLYYWDLLFFFSLRKYQPLIVQLDSWICLFCFIFIYSSPQQKHEGSTIAWSSLKILAVFFNM